MSETPPKLTAGDQLVTRLAHIIVDEGIPIDARLVAAFSLQEYLADLQQEPAA